MESIGLEFARFVVRQNPGVTDFVSLYDAMSRAAAMRSFRDLGYRELAEAGVSFSLLATGELDALIHEAMTIEQSEGDGQQE